jgi:hypothetical protein
MGKDFYITLSIIGLLLSSAFMPSKGIAHAENSTMSVQTGKPKVSVQADKTDFFCGYCHVLTYPRVMKKAYTSWKAGKHKNVGCVECHYPPELTQYSIPQHKEIPRDERYAGKKSEWDFMRQELEVLSRLITIQNMDEPVVRTKPIIDDLSCSSARCHPTTGKGKEGEYWTKKLDYTQYEKADKTKVVVQFTHDKHFDKKKWVEGHELHCTSCHQRESEKKHFEVTKEKCFLCHFKNAEFNIERAKCSLCHEIPTKPLQSQKKESKPGEEGKDAEKAITHKTLEEAKVSCQSCHLHLIRDKGLVSKEKCFNCHDKEERIMKEVTNKKLMHQEHVAKQAAACFNCHQPIKHNKEADYIDTARETCTVCHPNHHMYQRILLTADGPEGVQKTPALMHNVATNCIGCHSEAKTVKGEIVLAGSGKSCAACHTEKHEGMPKQWMDDLKTNYEETKEVEKELLAAIENAKDKKPMEKLAEAKTMLEKGREFLQIVEFGGGVHNQKYSVMLLDEAFGNFADAIDLLNE